MSAGDDARTGGRNANAFDHNNDDSHRHARSQQWATRRGGIARGTEAGTESVAWQRCVAALALRNPWLLTQSAAKTKLE